ncbi:hypothetical protein WI460_14940 [Gemmatimonadota bacterium Y43]|uniref:hypothetical protein n=1 Tax=Gaopeijia maritima TaxID=3119007 RepID=UPI003289EE53
MPDDPDRRATRWILTASALFFATLGGAMLFAPVEVASAFGWTAGEAVGSLAAGGLLSLAVLDFTARGAIHGGIYGRPIVLANLVFVLTAGLALLRAQLATAPAEPLGWLLVGGLALHGVAFGLMLVGRLGGPGRG